MTIMAADAPAGQTRYRDANNRPGQRPPAPRPPRPPTPRPSPPVSQPPDDDREPSQNPPQQKPPAPVIPINPSFIGCCDTQKAEIKAAIQDTISRAGTIIVKMNLALIRLETLPSSGVVSDGSGQTYNAADLNLAKIRLRNARQNMMATRNWLKNGKFWCGDPLCVFSGWVGRPGLPGFANHIFGTIAICNDGWKKAAGSPAAFMIHEASHLAANTRDPDAGAQPPRNHNSCVGPLGRGFPITNPQECTWDKIATHYDYWIRRSDQTFAVPCIEHRCNSTTAGGNP